MKYPIKRESCISDHKGVQCLLLWCSDGWRYNLETFKRHRFIEENGLFIEEEPFSKKVFSDVLYYEHVEVIPVSEKPKIWIEKGDRIEKFSEM
jgi:hypothetical protein